MQAINAFNRGRKLHAENHAGVGPGDPPGIYKLQIKQHEMNNPLLTALVARAGISVSQRGARGHDSRLTGGMYDIIHSTLPSHTLSWSEDLTDNKGNLLPAGVCVLSEFPMVSFGGRAAQEMYGGQLDALCWLVRRCAAEPQNVFYRREVSGRYPTQSLLIANTPSSLELVLELCKTWPRLMTVATGNGQFTGATNLHLLAINRREVEMRMMVDQAALRLTKPQYTELLSMQASGDFFHGCPMVFFGSTAIAFAASFGLKTVIVSILEHDRRAGLPNRLHDETTSCRQTGLLPLHCAVANGQAQMFDFLTGAHDHLAPVPGELRLPRELLADPVQLSSTNVRQRGHWRAGIQIGNRLTPLQLTAKLGDQRMCSHIL
eukprot:4257474-Prymnesium_polylepis.1